MKKLTILLIALSFPLSFQVAKSQNHSLINLGVSAGGSGFIGIPLQLRPSQNLAFEVGVYARGVHSNVFEPIWHYSVAADAGFSVFFSNRLKEEKNRFVSNGIYFKAGMARSALDEDFLGIGWVKEIQKSNSGKRFVQLQIGPSAIRRTETFLNTRYPPGYQEQVEEWWTGMIHFRLTWFFI